MATQLETITNPGVSRQVHKVSLSDLCPMTGNPIQGSFVVISYAPVDKLLEIYSLNAYVNGFTGSQEVRDLEMLVKVVADACSQALEAPVTVLGKFVLNVNQTIISKAESNGA